MKTILLHGLGQNAHDWEKVTSLIHDMEVDCPNIFATTEMVFHILRLCTLAKHDLQKNVNRCVSVVFLLAQFSLWIIQFDTAAM